MTITNVSAVNTVTFVNNTVLQLDVLRARRINWEATDFKKANDGLYALLAETLEIYQNKFLQASDEERKNLRKELETSLKTSNITVQKNSLTLTMLVRYVFSSDRKRAQRYAYVLKAAVSHGVAAKDLPNFIISEGGIELINRKMVQSEAAKQRQAEVAQAKTQVLVDLEQAAVNPLARVTLHGLTGEYAILLAKPGVAGEAAIIGALSDIEGAIYKALLNKMAVVKAATNAEIVALNKEVNDLLAPANDIAIHEALAA